MPTPFLGRLADDYRKRAVRAAFLFQDAFYRIAVVFFGATVLIWLSVFGYGLFYYFYMPQVAHVRPVDFSFDSCGEKAGICSFPSANVTLSSRFTDGVLFRGQPYRVILALDVPESPVNQNLGMFMVHISLLDSLGVEIRSSQKAALMKYRSPLARWMYTLAVAPFLIAGATEENEAISVELFDSYEENPNKPTVAAFIELRTRFIEIYSAHLHVHARFTGLRYLMFYHPWISAFVGVSVNAFLLTLVAGFSWHKWILKPILLRRRESVVRVGFDDFEDGGFGEDTDGVGASSVGGPAGVRKTTTASLEARRAELREKLEKRRSAASLLSDASAVGVSPPVGVPASDPSSRSVPSRASGGFQLSSGVEEIPYWEGVKSNLDDSDAGLVMKPLGSKAEIEPEPRPSPKKESEGVTIKEEAEEDSSPQAIPVKEDGEKDDSCDVRRRHAVHKSEKD